jgi:hypothetical protein
MKHFIVVFNHYLILISNIVIIAVEEPWNYPLFNSDVISLLPKSNRHDGMLLPSKLIPRRI